MLIIISIVEYFKEKTTHYQDQLDRVRNTIRLLLPFFNKITFFRRILTNRGEQRIRVRKNYMKLRCFLLPLAKELMLLKKQQYHTLIERNLNSNITTNHLSVRSPSLVREGQSLFRNPYLADSLNFSKNTTSSYAIDKVRHQQINQIHQTFDTNQYPLVSNIDHIKENQDQ